MKQWMVSIAIGFNKTLAELCKGVEFPAFPQCLEAQGGDEEDERIVVADMSSNFLSRKVDVSKYSVIYVGNS